MGENRFVAMAGDCIAAMGAMAVWLLLIQDQLKG
jgi:hypothetical protein